MAQVIQWFNKLSKAPFEVLLAPHIEPLYRIAYRLTGSQPEAEDMVQGLLTKLYSKPQQVEGVQQLRPWLAKAMYHYYVSDYRRKQRDPLAQRDDHSDMEQFHTEDNPEQQLLQSDVQKTLTRHVAGLPNDQRMLIILHDIEGYDLKEIEHILGIPLGTVKSRLHRAREKLRHAIAMEPNWVLRRVGL